MGKVLPKKRLSVERIALLRDGIWSERKDGSMIDHVMAHIDAIEAERSRLDAGLVIALETLVDIRRYGVGDGHQRIDTALRAIKAAVNGDGK